MRTLIKEAPKNVNEKIVIRGWLHKKRLLGGLNFINVRDRSGLIQIILEDKQEVEKLRGSQIGTVLEVSGKVKKDERAPGGVELHEVQVTILVDVSDTTPLEIDKPINHKSENLDTLFDNRVVALRNLQEQKIFKIRSAIIQEIRKYLIKNDFIEINTPKILAGATEGGAEVFKLDYFGKEATLAQSPQLYKQIMVGVFERVYEIAPAFRAELSATTRHVSEVTMLDVEIGFIDSLDDVLKIVETMTYKVLVSIYDIHKEDLKSLSSPDLMLKEIFPRFSVKEIHSLYSKFNKIDVSNEKDLTPDEEKWICEYAKDNKGCEAVFVTDFPVSAMKFYHKINPKDKNTVLWADLLFRGVEIATCPVRENDLNTLISQMKSAGLDPNHPGYKYYLQAFKYGLPPHGGCGFGIDRFVEKTIGLSNVKEAILFPRDINRLAP
jgi:nondiscriminating aspartyl-tRNA synthetase